MNPQYPVYIVSKGRWESRQTVRTLEYMRVPYHIVIEPQEYLQYAAVVNSKKILVLPFSNLGQGSIPARNWIWEHAKKSGAKRHWILDDNIAYFYRLNYNVTVVVNSGTILRVTEDFVDRYQNIALAGLQYAYLIPRKAKSAPFVVNSRVYSCILIDNSLPYRWRGRYNEDTDLSIRVLKDGYCTVYLNAFLCGKTPTLQMRGGNASIYNETNQRKEFAEALQKQHPDIVEVVWKFNRWHHKVDYSGFKNNKLIFKPGIKIKDSVDNYGMELIHFKENKSIFNGK
jgi:hypothetical protein